MSKKYNVMLITMDQLRYDCLGYSSDGFVETPSIDWIRGMGTAFTNAYTSAPSCIPARASLMTGQAPWRTGVLSTGVSAGPDKLGSCMGVNFAHTLAGELVKNGYHAEGIGKMHFFPQRAEMGFSHILLDESGREEDKYFCSDYKAWFMKNNPDRNNITDHGVHWNSWMARPFDADECYHPSNWTANETLEYLRRRDPTKPFFINMSFSRPHSPYDPSPYFFDMYMRKEDKLPKPVFASWDEKYSDNGEDGIMAWHGTRTEDEYKRMRAGYSGSITQTDYQIGKVLAWLNKAKLLDEMLIIFTSDHGDMLGDHHLFRKGYAYEASSHIPMLIKLPRSLGGSVKTVNKAVTITDVMPTILSVLGLDVPENTDGKDVSPLIFGKDIDREYVTTEHTETFDKLEDHFTVTDGRYKFVWKYKANEEMFFDLKEDKNELNNAINEAKYAEIIAKMRKYAIDELEKRNCESVTFVRDGKLIPVPRETFVVSPNYVKRLETSDFNWMTTTRTNETII